MSLAFTLGKYAPFHRGHQLVIETALAEVGQVIVVIYEAPEAHEPLAMRAAWIRELYPQVEVIEADGPTAVGDAPELVAAHEAYLERLLGDRGITHFYSSEFYGAHVSRLFGAIDRRVDPGRVRVPVAGRDVRRDPFAHRAFLHPRVYRDLITKVVFLGAPSTGKTTIAETMAARMNTVWMPEYGREVWERESVDRRLTREQLLGIAIEHRRREEALLLDANRYLFVDTDATTTRQFSRYYYGDVLPALEALADEGADRYALTFLCEDDIPYADTEDRSGEANRAEFQAAIRADLAARGRPYVSLRGSLEERVAAVRHELAAAARQRLDVDMLAAAE
jgi:HTH-type transcriptional repressor of NAD biosynthesis genes